MNRYGYVTGNPLGWTDPFGLAGGRAPGRGAYAPGEGPGQSGTDFLVGLLERFQKVWDDLKLDGLLPGEGVLMGATLKGLKGVSAAERQAGRFVRSVSPSVVSEGLCEETKLISAAERFGIHLSEVEIHQGVARAKIHVSWKLNRADVKTLTDYFASQGATVFEVDSGVVIHPKLSDFLSRRVQDGKPFLGGTVTGGEDLPGTLYRHAYTLTFKP